MIEQVLLRVCILCYGSGKVIKRVHIIVFNAPRYLRKLFMNQKKKLMYIGIYLHDYQNITTIINGKHFQIHSH